MKLCCWRVFSPPATFPEDLIAEVYVRLVLDISRYSNGFMDTYSGLDSLKPRVKYSYHDTYRSYVINYNLGKDLVSHRCCGALPNR
ncbi:MAG: hypothetical protein KKG00_05645 [Bacteroidetes bacterium]|nr:hypothetical protein [Bacteroidota bacterium]